MNYKIGCFNCGEEAYYNVEKTTTKINCTHCNYEASAFSLIIDQIANLESKIKDVYRKNTRVSEVNYDLEKKNKLALAYIEDNYNDPAAVKVLKEIEELNKESE